MQNISAIVDDKPRGDGLRMPANVCIMICPDADGASR